MNEALRKLLEEISKSEAKNTATLEQLAKSIVAKADEEITAREKLKNDAIASRDKAKARVRDIASHFGITATEVNDELIEKIKEAKKASGKDNIKDKEIEELKKQVQEFNGKLQEAEQDKKTTITKLMLEKDLALSLPKYKAVPKLQKYLIDDIMRTADFEDGKVIFRNEDGTTMRINGKDATVDDILEMKRAEEEKDGQGVFFDLTPQQSGGKGGGSKVEEDDFLSR